MKYLRYFVPVESYRQDTERLSTSMAEQAKKAYTGRTTPQEIERPGKRHPSLREWSIHTFSQRARDWREIDERTFTHVPVPPACQSIATPCAQSFLVRASDWDTQALLLSTSSQAPAREQVQRQSQQGGRRSLSGISGRARAQEMKWLYAQANRAALDNLRATAAGAALPGTSRTWGRGNNRSIAALRTSCA